MSQPNLSPEATAALLTIHRPATETRKVTRAITKRIDDPTLTAEEVLEAYRRDKPEDFEKELTDGERATKAAYAMPLERLKQKADAQIRDVYHERREQYRIQNAVTWQSTPGAARYKPTVKNAEAIIAALDEFKVEGSVTDMQAAFDYLASQGKLELNPQPFEAKPVYSLEEFRSLSLPEMEEAMTQMKKDGIV